MFYSEYGLSVNAVEDLDQYESLGSNQKVSGLDEAVDTTDAVVKMGFPGWAISLIIGVLVLAAIIIGIVIYKKKQNEYNDPFWTLYTSVDLQDTYVEEKTPSCESLFKRTQVPTGGGHKKFKSEAFAKMKKVSKPGVRCYVRDFYFGTYWDFTSDDIKVCVKNSSIEDTAVTYEIKVKIAGALNEFKKAINELEGDLKKDVRNNLEGDFKDVRNNLDKDVTDIFKDCINTIDGLETEDTKSI